MELEDKILYHVVEQSTEYLKKVNSIPIGVKNNKEEILSCIDTTLPDKGEDPKTVLKKLTEGVEKGLIGNRNPRYFGNVFAGTTPTALAADWLTSVWNQNARVYNTSPAASIFEDIVASWLLELLMLPKNSAVGFVTGGQMANFTAINIARNSILETSGWDFDKEGLQGAPNIFIFCADVCHATILSAIRMSGFGEKNIVPIETDFEGRMIISRLAEKLRSNKGLKIICSQAGNVNTGSFDSFEEIAALANEYNAWHHVDGAFGLWCRVSYQFSKITKGMDKADSWTVDAHKWLSVPFDSGMIITRHKESLANIKKARCAYSGKQEDFLRDGSQWVPENSRRARGFVLYATLRNFGKEGLQEIIDKNCNSARQLAEKLNTIPYAKVINQVHLNQVLYRLEPQGVKNLDLFHQDVAKWIQEEGTSWLGTSIWKGITVLRMSLTNIYTESEDIENTFEVIKRAIEQVLKKITKDESIHNNVYTK